MSAKTIKGRVINKHKTEAEWRLDVYGSDGKKRDDCFVPYDGELIIYDPDDNYNHRRLKIGDGKTDVVALPFWQIDPATLSTTDKTLVGAINELDKEGLKHFTVKVSYPGVSIPNIYQNLLREGYEENSWAFVSLNYNDKGCNSFMKIREDSSRNLLIDALEMKGGHISNWKAKTSTHAASYDALVNALRPDGVGSIGCFEYRSYTDTRIGWCDEDGIEYTELIDIYDANTYTMTPGAPFTHHLPLVAGNGINFNKEVNDSGVPVVTINATHEDEMPIIRFVGANSTGTKMYARQAPRPILRIQVVGGGPVKAGDKL